MAGSQVPCQRRINGGVFGGMGSDSAGMMSGSGRAPAADEKMLKVNLLDIRNALQLFSTELEGIISGTGT